MTLAQERALDVAEIAAADGVPITVNGEAVTALVSRGEITHALEMGGFIESGRLVIKILKTALTSAPAQGDDVEIDGRAFVVDGVESHAQFPAWVLSLKGASE